MVLMIWAMSCFYLWIIADIGMCCGQVRVPLVFPVLHFSLLSVFFLGGLRADCFLFYRGSCAFPPLSLSWIMFIAYYLLSAASSLNNRRCIPPPVILGFPRLHRNCFLRLYHEQAKTIWNHPTQMFWLHTSEEPGGPSLLCTLSHYN